MEPRSPANFLSALRLSCACGLLCLAVLTVTGSQKFKPSPPPSAGKALIYIYRPGRMLGAAIHFTVFINDYFLAEIHNSNYAAYEVPEGQVVVTTTVPITGKYLTAFNGLPSNNIPSTTGFWAALPGCADLDWGRLALAPPEKIELCDTNLTALYQECGATVTTTGCAGCVMITRTMHVPKCNHRLDGSGNALYLLSLATMAHKLPFTAEAGHSYYFRWSLKFSSKQPTRLELVDESTGAKEIRGLKLAKNR
ncbi:MAG TPA: hypothetical protein VEU11_01945 [Terriglobales bacterium]|nr:hypothetical protein [Terriglobales bacterium]